MSWFIAGSLFGWWCLDRVVAVGLLPAYGFGLGLFLFCTLPLTLLADYRGKESAIRWHLMIGFFLTMGFALLFFAFSDMRP